MGGMKRVRTALRGKSGWGKSGWGKSGGMTGRRAGVALGGALLGVALLALSACADDPANIGITGPFPEGVAPVTLTRPVPRMEKTDDTPGVRVTDTDHFGSILRQRNGGNATRRYYGYDH